MLPDRFISRHTPTEHLLLEPAVTELERELQRRLTDNDDQIDADALLLNALNDFGVTAANTDELADLVDAAKDIDAKDLREGAAFLKVIGDRGFEAGEADELRDILRVFGDADLVTAADLRRVLDEHARMRALLVDAEDIFEALDGTSVSNEELLDEYRLLTGNRATP